MTITRTIGLEVECFVLDVMEVVGRRYLVSSSFGYSSFQRCSGSFRAVQCARLAEIIRRVWRLIVQCEG